MERIGIYGGAFNPPHAGHIAAAKFALESLQLSRLLVIPSCVSPHKPQPADSASPDQRLQMLQIAFCAENKIEVSDLELRRGSVSYTYETVEQIHLQYPQAELILFMGTDMFLSFQSWRHPEKILKNASLAVFYRGEKEEIEKIREVTEELRQAGHTVYPVENPVTEISSTDLRRMLVFDGADSFLPTGVKDYIVKNGLYGTGKNYRNLTEAELEQTVLSLLPTNRVAHVLGCRQVAQELARLYGADETDACRAALLHDVTKALKGSRQLTLCREYGITLDEFFTQNPNILHALTGSLVAQRIFGENPQVVAAIACHTTGKADMTTLEKIIYIADYIEPSRDFDGVEQLRKLAYTDLDGAVAQGLRNTLALLQWQGRQISRESVQALEYLERRNRKC